MRVESSQSLRATRWIARGPRVALLLTCATLGAAGVRSIIRPAGWPLPPRPVAVARDPGVESVAERFARDYLSWGGEVPAARAQSQDVEPPVAPAGSKQRVTWTTVTRVERAGSAWTVTVAARTSRGDYDLAVPVRRTPRGLLAVVDPPAIVGSVPTTRSERPATEREVDQPTLTAVARRVIRNYLEGDRPDLLADLTNAAVVVLPDTRLRLIAIDRLTWARPTTRVAALVRVRSTGGVELTLRYELAVTRRAGRWLVQAIHTNPKPEVHP